MVNTIYRHTQTYKIRTVFNEILGRKKLRGTRCGTRVPRPFQKLFRPVPRSALNFKILFRPVPCSVELERGTAKFRGTRNNYADPWG